MDAELKRNIRNGLLGVSPAAILAGLHHGLKEFKTTICETTARIRPLESAPLRSIPALTLEQLLAGRRASVAIDVQEYTSGMLPWRESVALLSLITVANPAVVLEIGTFMGFTAKVIARSLPNAVVHTLDLPLDFKPDGDASAIHIDDFHLIQERTPGREFLNTPEAARIRQHFGNSATWDYSLAAGATCFFIDGSHTYEHCKIDSEKCYELCGGKGVFFWHDCDDGHPGVVRFAAEWREQGRALVRIKETNLAYWDSRATG
jgi:hypothetical protein